MNVCARTSQCENLQAQNRENRLASDGSSLASRVLFWCLSQEENQEDDGKKGKKKKFKVMETIKEETLSALRAFLTIREENET
jgi:hypothetical protein